MTEEEVANLGETTPKEGGTEVEPQPKVSSAEEKDSPSAENLVEALKANPEFKSLVESYFQPWKDRRLDKHEKRLDGFESQLAEFEALKKEGWTDAQAKRLMKLGQNAIEEEPSEPAQSPDSPGTTEVVASEFDADSFYREQGLDPNLPEIVEMIRKGATPNEHFSYAWKVKSRPEQPPNPAQVMPTGTGETSGRSRDEVLAEIQKESTNPKGVNFAKMKELETELKSL
jgi:hypothetical protein